jgi:hypothetical protein
MSHLQRPSILFTPLPPNETAQPLVLEVEVALGPGSPIPPVHLRQTPLLNSQGGAVIGTCLLPMYEHNM